MLTWGHQESCDRRRRGTTGEGLGARQAMPLPTRPSAPARRRGLRWERRS